MATKVVVTGRGLITPLGAGLAANIDALKAGVSGISIYDRFVETQQESLVAGKVSYPLECPAIDRKNQRFMPHNAQMAVCAAYEAIQEAGYTMETLPGDRMAVINGCGGGSYGELYDSVKKYQDQNWRLRAVTPFSVPRIMPSSAVANLSLIYGIKGESYDISCACTSGAMAIVAGARLIRSGEYDIVMVGGSEEVSWQQALGFNAMKALSKNFNDAPEKASRPFDRDRNGFVIAEGAGVLILESEEHAKKRGAKIICELSGFSANSNAADMVVPDADASAEVMRRTVLHAGLKPEDIDYINTHGTSTGVGDPLELDAIKEVFGADGKTAINSTKSQTGHMIGATGAVEAIYTTLMMEHSFISPTINLENREEGYEWADIVTELREGVTIRHGLSNSFGFGGSNASLIFSKYDA